MNAPTTAALRLLAGDREPVIAATTGNVALSGLQTIDGVVLVAGDRVLVKMQADRTQNGIYTAGKGAWYRAPDANTTRAINRAVKVAVQAGASNAGRIYSARTLEPDIGSDEIIWDLFLAGTNTVPDNVGLWATLTAGTTLLAGQAGTHFRSDETTAAASLTHTLPRLADCQVGAEFYIKKSGPRQHPARDWQTFVSVDMTTDDVIDDDGPIFDVTGLKQGEEADGALVVTPGDKRPRFTIQDITQRIITAVPRWIRVTEIDGNAQAEALNGALSEAVHPAQEGFNPTRVYANGLTLADGYAYSSGGKLAMVCRTVRLRVQGSYVRLAKVDSARWAILECSPDAIPEGRDLIRGRMDEDRYKGFASPTNNMGGAEFYVSSNYSRIITHTSSVYETHDVAETTGHRAQAVAGSSHPDGPELTFIGAGTGAYVIWAAGWAKDGGTGGSWHGRGAQIQFAAVGAHSLTNAAMQIRLGVTLEGTTGTRQFVQYVNSDERVTFGRATVGVLTPGKVNTVQRIDEPAQLIYNEITGQTAPLLILRANEATAVTAYDFLTCQTGMNGGGSGSPKMRIRGDGTIYTDTLALGGAAGLSEMLATHKPGAEPKPGEDFDGRTVVLVDAANYDRIIGEGVEDHANCYVRLADTLAERPADDDIVGVVHSMSPLKGASGGLRKHDKYLTDPFGKPLTEEAEFVSWTVYDVNDAAKREDAAAYTAMERQLGGFVDDLDREGTEIPPVHDGKLADVIAREEATAGRRENFTFVSAPARRMVSRWKLNPAFDPAMPYQPREERLEWAASVDADGNVTGGLYIEIVGMCPVRDDQPKPKRWRKVRQVAPGVSLYYVK